MEAIVNNNNSLVAPIRGFDFGEFLGTMELSTSTTLNLQLHSARTGKFVAVSLPISILLDDSVHNQMEDWPDHSPLSFSPSSSSSGPTREPCMGCTRDVSDEAGSVHIKFQRA